MRELSEELRPESAALVLLALEDLERQGPLPEQGWSVRGKAWMLHQQPAAAREALAQGLAAHPGSLVLQLNLAAAELALGAAAAALALLEALELPQQEEPRRRAALLRNRAQAAAECGQHALALRDLEALRQLEGDSDSLLWSLAAAYEQVENLPQAALLYRQLLRDRQEADLGVPG